eukprot:jgi/Mesen1/8970/ME000056S08374
MADHPESSEKREDEEEHFEEEEEEGVAFVPSKPVGLKEQLELDKDDESLVKWKQQLLGDLSISEGGKSDPEVEFRLLSIKVDGRPDIELPIPKKGEVAKKESATFVLKEKSSYRLEFEFTVKNEILLGLQYLNRVWRLGKQVDKTKVMLGAYGPQEEPYRYITEEEVTPSGMLARGHYTAKTIFADDDGRIHLEYDYSFSIKKEWAGSDE